MAPYIKSDRTADVDSSVKLAAEDEWITDFDVGAFKADVQELGAELLKGQGEEDIAHLNKIIMWSNICAIGGVLTAGLSPYYLVPMILLSTGTFSRWTMIAHHTCHGGYDKCDKTGRFNRFTFAVGSVKKRFFDWFDWMLPEAWNVEHNNLHHYHLGEVTDPDLVENNLAALRGLGIPVWAKHLVVAFFATTWKWFYYSPNTFKELKLKEMRQAKTPIPQDGGADFKNTNALTWVSFLTPGYLPSWLSLSEYLSRVFVPYFVYRFLLIPLPWMFVGDALGYGSTMYWNAVTNMVLADILTNMHGFLTIVTNHAGDDLYRFEKHCRPRSGEFYLRQVISSADFAAGDDLTDFAHGWLNYQIEHHLWPDLSMLSYQRSMPLVKAICKRHGVPYVQESVFRRLKKTVDIMVGVTSMRQYPVEFENPKERSAPMPTPSSTLH